MWTSQALPLAALALLVACGGPDDTSPPTTTTLPSVASPTASSLASVVPSPGPTATADAPSSSPTSASPSAGTATASRSRLQVSVSPTSGVRGTKVMISGSVCLGQPMVLFNDEEAVNGNGPPREVPAQASGGRLSASFTLTVDDEPGEGTVRVKCQNDGGVAGFTVRTQPKPTQGQPID